MSEPNLMKILQQWEKERESDDGEPIPHGISLLGLKTLMLVGKKGPFPSEQAQTIVNK